MSRSSSHAVSFKWGALAVTAVTLLSVIPQLHFWMLRGSQWQGAYATLQHDELLYSAYINALIDGRPRRNDPFTGQDDQAGTPLPETAFSIQLIPPYLISSLARVFGLTASTAFIALAVVAGLLASLSVFWLLISITGERRIAAAGVLFVLSFGAMAAGQGLVGLLLDKEGLILGLLFQRRYQPAASFYLFFVFCTLVWRALTIEEKRRAPELHSVFAGAILAVLIFSYLYLWTAAVVWLGCATLLWLQRSGQDRKRSLKVSAIIVAISLFALVPYAYLVSHRAETLDQLQTLTLTHRPDLFRLPEIIGVFILFAIVLSERHGKIKRGEPRVIIAASFALLPIIVFNQQILTGRSMQPFHFEYFIANYAVLVSAVIVVTLLSNHFRSRSLLRFAALCFVFGLTEVSLATRAYYPRDAMKDQTIPVLLRLKEISNHNATNAKSTLVFSPNIEVMELLPTWAPQGTLLGIGTIDFGSATHQERKELLLAYLYYSGSNPDRLGELLRVKRDEVGMSNYVRDAVFGHERVTPTLIFDFKPIKENEIEDEIDNFQTYITNFSHQDVLRHPLTYLVTRTGRETDLSRVDQWHERDAGEQIGAYTLFHLTLRK